MSALRQALEGEVQRLATEHGGVVTPAQVVEAARDPANPLHEEFEWDDSVAAEQWRLAQARTLIRSIRVVVSVHNVQFQCQGYVHDPDTNGQGYTTIARLRTDRDRAEQALAVEINRVTSSAARAREIALGLELSEQIEQQLRQAISAA
jgi:hypothetical protein